MRKPLITAAVCALAACTAGGCTALMVGGGSSAGRHHGAEAAGPQASADGATAAAVRRRLGADTLLGGFDLSVSATGGRVTLRGTVSSYAARQRAAELAAGVDAVTAVENRIVVRRN